MENVKGAKIAQIKEHYKSGKRVEEIIALGFHPTTVKIQVAKLKKEVHSEKV